MSRDFLRRDGGDDGDEQYPTGVKPGAVSLTSRLPATRGGGGGVPHQEQMEAAFGQDFSFVQAYTGQRDAMDSIGASAATRGNTVAFADEAPIPWLVAHELTHVVQQEKAGGGDVAAKATVAPVESAAEREADAVADRVARGEPAGEITAQPTNMIYRFAPNHHRHATVDGLAGSFSAEEIGAIYASNWERDFSQGNADIASAAIAWTAVKNHAAKHGGDPGATAATFQAAIWKVVNGDIGSATDESLGGYKTWEHMDAPDSKGDREKADKRWAGKSAGVAGYIMDSKAHIKDQMVMAIDVYRQLHSLDKVGGSIDNWNGAAKPEGYQTPSSNKDKNGKVTTYFPAGYDGGGMASRDPIREQTADQAKGEGAKSDPSHNADHWRLVGQHLGRAMHAFEDFWAHSNWLELAKMVFLKEKGIHGPWDQVNTGNSALKTGTFGMPAKAHALGHKLLAMATAFQSDFALLLKVYGRTSASTKIDDPAAKAGRSTFWGTSGGSDHNMAYAGLRTDSMTPLGEISDVATATNDVEELVLSGKYKMEDFLCNQNWLAALAQKGRVMIEEGDKESDADSHGKIAKDQPEGDGAKDHGGAMALAVKANEMVFGPLRAVMDEKDAAKALAATQKQLELIDQLLVAPHAGHPLWGILPAAIAGDGDGHHH
jgi:hypothetical protein